MDNQFSNKTKIIMIITYFLLVIITELFYRKPLQELSITFILFLQKKITNNKIIEIFLIIITNFGSEKVLIPIVLIFLFFNPLIYSYYLIFSLMTSTYIASLLKLIYSNYRPYWDNNNAILPIVNCDMGYGNPSGHTLVSTVTYLGLWKLLQKNRIKKRKWTSLTILFCMILMILSIIFTRIIGGVHNLNQILFGFLLGLGMYLIYYHLYKFYNKQPEMFFIFIEENKKILNIIFIILYLISLPTFFMVNDKENKEKFNDTIISKCGNDKIPSIHKQYSYEGFKGTSLMIGLIGILNGILYSKNKMEIQYAGKEYIIMEWHNLTFKNKIFRFTYIAIYTLPGLIFFLIPSCFPIVIIMLFKYTISFLLVGFLCFGPGMYYSFIKTFKDEEKNIENISKVVDYIEGEVNNSFSTDD